MAGLGLSRRARVFLVGVGLSLAIVAVFVLGARLQFALTGGGAGRFNILYRLLVWIFLAANPVFALVGWASLALPSRFSASREGQVLIGSLYVATFLGGWWLMATVIDRLLVLRSRRAR